MSLSIRHLRLVHYVATEGTLTGAARRLYLTQSALSHQLADLERYAGAPVFIRVGKKMVLTAVGRRIVSAAETALDCLDALEADLRRIKEGKAGELRVTTQCHTAYYWLPEILPEFRRRHPAIDFRIVPEAGPTALDAILKGEVDVALTFETIDEDVMLAVPLFEDEQVLIVAPGHPLTRQTFVTAEDFRTLDLLSYRKEPSKNFLHEMVLRPAGVEPRSMSEIRITEGIVALVASGLGAATVSRWSVAPHIMSGTVVPLRITEFGLRRQWRAAALKSAEDNRAAMDFIGLMERGPSWAPAIQSAS